MATQSKSHLKHRKKEEERKGEAHDQIMNNGTAATAAARKRRRQRATRGLKSLGIAVVFPMSLTLLDISLFGASQQQYGEDMEKQPFWVPRLWALHLACVGSAFLMGVSAWLVWVDGGFHRRPAAVALYLSQLALGLAWDPVVFRAGATRAGLVLCLGLVGALVGCARTFKNVNPIAGDLVKPCLGWAFLVSVANLRLISSR